VVTNLLEWFYWNGFIGMALLEWLYYNENYNSNHAQHGDFIKPAIPDM
jgi:hypothetical protein